VRHSVCFLPALTNPTLRIEYDGSPRAFFDLRIPVAVYLILHFDIPRPKALLGHQHFTRLTGQIDRVRGLHPSGAFHTFRFSAAGKDSAIFTRLKDALADYTHMTNEPDDADLMLRVRPALSRSSGWEVLIRTTPRPLATRAWRVRDRPGALNATIAAAMIEMSAPRPDDRFFNPMCGSGTLLIERALRAPAQVIGGCDTDLEALRCAHANIDAAGLADQIEAFEMDATSLDIPDAVFDVICTDLPWGQLSGSHVSNADLYPAALTEFARVAAPRCRLVALTHEVTLFEHLLNQFADRWHLHTIQMVYQGGLHPRIYLLERLP
jgi:tRNA (guanine6-N2)-methyltransferase